MTDLCDTEEGKKAIEKLADSIREEIDKEVLKEFFEIIKKQNDDAWDRGKGVFMIW